MKTYYRDFYGSTASIRLNRDGSATLVVKDGHGKYVYGKCYGSETGAKRAMGRLGDCWKKIKS